MIRLPSLPKVATAPFCPSEIQGSIEVPANSSTWKSILTFAGPGLLVAVGYMDPGNWATDIEAGSRFGYSLLSIVLFSSFVAVLLQCLCVRVGLIAGKDLAILARERYQPATRLMLWVFAELAIIATDVAEVLGSALALKLLFGFSLKIGIAITALDTIIVLGLKGKGFRQVEAIILGLVATIGVCYIGELLLIKPYWPDVVRGYAPSLVTLKSSDTWYIAIGILGATVMPHNLYLHSSIVQTRKVGKSIAEKSQAIKFATLDTAGALTLAFLVNSAILILAAAAFHVFGHQEVKEIDDAYRLLEPVVGTSLAGILFGVALLASGQSSTFTGTIAGQILLEGFLNLKIPCWQRRIITRTLAIIPALVGVILLGEHSTGRLLVLSQVILSFQLPFAIYPLIKFASDEHLMGVFRIGVIWKTISWSIFGIISLANIWLIYQLIST